MCKAVCIRVLTYMFNVSPSPIFLPILLPLLLPKVDALTSLMKRREMTATIDLREKDLALERLQVYRLCITFHALLVACVVACVDACAVACESTHAYSHIRVRLSSSFLPPFFLILLLSSSLSFLPPFLLLLLLSSFPPPSSSTG